MLPAEFGYLARTIEKAYYGRISENNSNKENKRMEDKPIIITGGHFYGNLNFGYVDKQYNYPNKPESKPEESEEEKPADKETTEKKPSDKEPDEEKKKEEQLRKVLNCLANVIKANRKYKWGLAKQALVRKGLIDARTSIRKFAETVNKYTGISVNTIRSKSEYYIYDREYESSIKDLCAVIENALKHQE